MPPLFPNNPSSLQMQGTYKKYDDHILSKVIITNIKNNFCFSIRKVRYLGHLHYVKMDYNCHNPSLGLTTKARVRKSVGQERSSGVWKSVRINTHTPKWTPMLGVEVPVDSQNFRKRLQRVKLLALKNFLYHWKAIEV